ncbi:MAK10-like protein [Tanacetum coccineum]
MGDENPNRTLGDYSKPSHEGYRNIIELHVGKTERTRLCLFQFSLRDLASNWLERLLAGFITTWEDLTTRFLAQFFLSGRIAKLRNDILRTIDQSAGGKLLDRNAEKSWALLEDLALYDNESWNDPRDFGKPVKEIALPQDVLMVLTTLSIAWKILNKPLLNTYPRVPMKREVSITPRQGGNARRKQEWISSQHMVSI